MLLYVEVSVKTKQQAVWGEILHKLQQKIGIERHNLWFKNTKLLKLDTNRITIGVPNLFVSAWIAEKFSATIAESAATVLGEKPDVEFRVDGSLFRKMRRLTETQNEEMQRNSREFSHGRLNSKMTMSRLVVGGCNRVVVSATIKLLEKPGRLYNPLFIKGAEGMGKTHILQSTSHLFREFRPEDSTLYTTSENFTFQFIWALKNKKMRAFRNLYRRADVLLVDNVHEFATKKATQQELLHTVDHLLNKHKQVVVSASTSVEKLKGFNKRFAGRLGSGLVVTLSPPAYATRLKIVESLLEDAASWNHNAAAGKLISQAVKEDIAKRTGGSVRSITSAVLRLVAYASLASKGTRRRPLTVAEARSILSELDSRKGITVEKILDMVGTYFNISKTALISYKRNQSAQLPRQIAMFLITELTSDTLSSIGKVFGGRTHSAVLFAKKKIHNLVDTDPQLRDMVSMLRHQLSE